MAPHSAVMLTTRHLQGNRSQEPVRYTARMCRTAPHAKPFAVTSGWWVSFRESHFSGGILRPQRKCLLWKFNWNYSLEGRNANYFRMARIPLLFRSVIE